MPKKYTTTDIPDDIHEESVMLIVSGQVKPADFGAASRLVARGIMLERDRWLLCASNEQIAQRFLGAAIDADESKVN